MSQQLPPYNCGGPPLGCNSECTCVGQIVDVPGPTGPSGADGSNGTDGLDSYTTGSSFTMPAELATVSVTVVSNEWMAIGQIVFAGDPAGAAQGYFSVVSKTGTTIVELRNLEDAATDAYLTNSAPGTVFPNLTSIGPAGIQGPGGADGTSGADTTNHYVTTQSDAQLTAAFSLGTLTTGLLKHTVAAGVSTPATASDGTDYLSPTTGLSKAGNLAGLADLPTSRTNLGLGSIATQAASAVAITGGAISATTIAGSTGSFTTLDASSTTTLAGKLVLTPVALQTLAAANTIAATGPKALVVGSGGPVTITAVPSLDNGTADGQEILIQGTHDTNTVTLQDSGTLAGSKLRLGATSRVLGAGDNVRLSWDATLAEWVETSFSALV